MFILLHGRFNKTLYGDVSLIPLPADYQPSVQQLPGTGTGLDKGNTRGDSVMKKSGYFSESLNETPQGDQSVRDPSVISLLKDPTQSGIGLIPSHCSEGEPALEDWTRETSGNQA